MAKFKNVYSIILLGSILRIIISTFTINWDFLKVTQITARLSDESLADIYRDPLSLYPQLTYLTRFFLIILFKPFLGDHFWAWTRSGDLTAISDPFIFRYLFFLKLPFIIIEIISAYIFSSLLKLPLRLRFLFLWMINPISLYTIAAFTNVDVFPIFFLAISLYFFRKKRLYVSSFSLGIAASYKFFPGLILPFLLTRGANRIEKLKILLMFMLPFILSQLPALTLPVYWSNSLMAGANRIIFTSILDIGHGKLLIYFIFFYLLLFFKYITESKKFNAINVFFLPLIPVFTVSAFNVQWVYWILPFLIFNHIFLKKDSLIRFFLYFSYFAIILLSQTALHIGMLAPIDLNLWTLNRELISLIGKESAFLTNLFYTTFSASILFISYRMFKNNFSESDK